MRNSTDVDRRPRRAAAIVAAVLAFMLAATATAVPASAAAVRPAAATAAVTSAPVAPNATAQPRLTEIVAIARKLATQRIPYVYGGGHGATLGSPSSGFDCSGLVRWVYAQVGWNLGTGTADSVRRSGAFVRTTHPVPGDLIFFGSSYAYHVGIYVSPGLMVDAPHPGTLVGVRAIYPGVMGYYHRKDATAFDSQPLRTTAHATVTVRSPAGVPVPSARVTVYAGPSCQQTVTSLWTNSRGQAAVTQLSGRYCLALTSAPHGYLTAGKRLVYLTAGSTVAWPQTAPYAPVPVVIRTRTTAGAVAPSVGVRIYRSDCRTQVDGHNSGPRAAYSLSLLPGSYCIRVVGAPGGYVAAVASALVTVRPLTPFYGVVQVRRV